MKNARHPQMQMTSALNSLNSNSTAQNLSKYAQKVLQRAVAGAAGAGFNVEIQTGRVFIVSPYGLKKAFSTVDDAAKYLGGLV
jgi:hypothetical protein